MSGWIKLHRSLRNNPYMQKPAYRAVWIELLLEAEHGMKLVKGKWVRKLPKEMKSVIWKGKQIYLKPGQLTCGKIQLSRWTKVKRGTVERIIKTFKNEEQIEEQTSNKFSLITINNWNHYQQNEEQNEEPAKLQRNSSGTPVRTPKEVKNVKNVKKSTTRVLEILKMSDKENLIPSVEELLKKHGEVLVKKVAMKVSLKSGSIDARWLQFVNWCGSERKDKEKKQLKYLN